MSYFFENLQKVEILAQPANDKLVPHKDGFALAIKAG